MEHHHFYHNLLFHVRVSRGRTFGVTAKSVDSETMFVISSASQLGKNNLNTIKERRGLAATFYIQSDPNAVDLTQPNQSIFRLSVSTEPDSCSHFL
jgi:hypothetical protein